MGVEVIYENDGEGIVYVHSGTLEGEAIVERSRLHYESLDYNKLRYQIVDFRGLERVEMTTEQLRELARIDSESTKKKRPDHKLAGVLDSDSMQAILKLWEVYLDNPAINVKIFWSMEAARKWIDEGDDKDALTKKDLGLPRKKAEAS